MKHVLNKVLLTLALMFVAHSVCAQNIAVVDMVKITHELQLEQKVQKKVNKLFLDEIAQFQKLRTEYEETAKKLEKDKVVMSQEKIREVMRDLESKKMKIQLDGKALDQDINVALMQHRDVVLEQVKESIQKVSKSKKYDLVLQKGAVLTYSDKVDISDFVIQDLTKNPLNISSLKAPISKNVTQVKK